MDTTDLDDKIREYEEVKDTQRRIELCIDISKTLLQQGQYEESRTFAFKGLSQLSEKKESASYDLNSVIGVGYMHQNEYEKAKAYLEQAMVVANQIGNTYQLACVANNLGCLAYGVNDYKEALTHFLRSEELSELHGYFANLWSTYLNTMRIHIDLHKYDQGLQYFNKIVSSCKDEHFLAQAYMAIGKLYFSIENLKLASYYTKQALKYYKGTDEKYFLVGCYLQLGDISSAKHRFVQATEYLNGAVLICTECHFDVYLFEALLMLAINYMRQGDIDKAKDYFMQLQMREDSVNDMGDKLSYFRNTRNYYAKIGDMIKAEEYDVKYEQLKTEYLRAGFTEYM